MNCAENAPCGRPLGMAFDTISDSLIVMQSYEGIFQVDLKTGKKNQLVSRDDVVGDEVRLAEVLRFGMEKNFNPDLIKWIKG